MEERHYLTYLKTKVNFCVENVRGKSDCFEGYWNNPRKSWGLGSGSVSGE